MEPNRATIPDATNLLIDRMLPEQYNLSMDLDIFIEECRRYFQLTNMDEMTKSLIVKTLLQKELVKTYEAVDELIIDFEERLRKAFDKPKSLIADLLEIMEYRKCKDSAETFFDKIDKLTTRLANHKWDKVELTKIILIHCKDDK